MKREAMTEAMIQDLEQIEYRKGMLENGMKPDGLPVKVWRGAKVPGEIREAINEDDILNLGGMHGDEKAGDPVEYDHVRLVRPDDTVEVTIFNLGIMLSTVGDSAGVRQMMILMLFLAGISQWQ